MPTRPEFVVTELLRLQVQEGWPDLPNLILNPNGEGGAWGWAVTDTTSSGTLGTSDYVRVQAVASGDWLQVRIKADLPSGDAGGAFYRVPITPGPGQKIRAAVEVLQIETAPAVAGFGVQFINPDGSLGLGEQFPDPLAVGLNVLPPFDVPDDAIAVLLGYAAEGAEEGHRVRFRDAWLVCGPEADVEASDPMSEPDWTDVLASAGNITVERDELNVGVLEATLFDSTLDPASTDLIRPGKRCRIDVLIGDTWESLFRGKLENPSSAYLVGDPRRSELRSVQIKLVASDAAADLANDPRSSGVATIDELPAVLAGTDVPFVVNGSSDAINPDTVVVVAVNDQASALDQVAVTRDSVLGFAWVDRNGVLQAWDRGELPSVVAAELDEAAYSAVDIDFDVDRTFNTITIKLLQINPGTGETEELAFGPYVDEAARRQWRTRKAEFTVQGVDPDLIPAYAAEILALNATPTKRINAVTIPLRTVDEIQAHALRDLYDLVSLSNDRAGVVGQVSRVTSVKHTITVRKEGARIVNRWTVELGFSTDGSVASPQVTPSPTAGGGKTAAQLLRPVGEVTMWLGAKADVPPGWLVLDGSAFDAATYPELDAQLVAAGLASGVLPNMTDRMPIGAGTKALLTSGSSALAGATAGDWRAVWFIVRAA